MGTHAVVLITKPEYNPDEETDHRILVCFPEIKEGAELVSIPKRIKWFIQSQSHISKTSEWTEGSTWVPNEAVEDFGIYSSEEESPNTALLEEITNKYTRGAISAKPPKGKKKSLEIRRVSISQVWDIPVLPVLKDVEESDELATRARYERPSGEYFYARAFAQGNEVTYLRDCRDGGDAVFLKSVPGTGKTAAIEAAFPNLITLICSANTERSDLIGGYVPVPATKENPLGVQWVNGPLLTAVIDGLPFYIDEIALADPRVMAVVYSLMDGRGFLEVSENPMIGTVTVTEGFYVIASTNPDAHGAILSDALLDRFMEHVDVRTDYNLALALGVEVKFVEFARRMEAKRVTGGVSWAPQMRSCLLFNRVANRSGLEHALSNELGKCPLIDLEEATDIAREAFGLSKVKPLALS